MSFLPIVWLGLSVLLAWHRPGFFVGCALASFQFSSFYSKPLLGPAFAVSLLALLVFVLTSRGRVPFARFDGAILAFTVFYLFSAIYPGDPFRAAEIAVRFAVFAITYYYAGRLLLHNADDETFITDIGISAVVLATVFGYLAAIDSSPSARLEFREGSAVGFSQSIDVALGFCVFYALSSLQKLRLPVATLLVFALIGTAWVAVLNATRGSLIAIGIAGLAFVLLRLLLPLGRTLVTGQVVMPALISHFRFFTMVSVFIGAGSALIVYSLSLPQYKAGINLLLYRFALLLEGGGESSEARVVLFQTAWDQFLQAPLLGRGVGSFARFAFHQYPHNMVLELLAECGIGGAVFFVAILVAALAKSVQNLRLTAFSRDSTIAFAILAIAVIHQQVSFALWMAKPLFLFMGVTVSMNAIARRGKQLNTILPSEKPYRLSVRA